MSNGETAFVLFGGAGAGGVIADGDDRASEVGSVAALDRLIVAVGATAFDGVIAQSEERRSDDAHDGFTTVDESE